MTVTLKGSKLELQITTGGESMTVQITLSAARVNKGLSQLDAANKVGVTAKTLRNYEKGKTAIPTHVFRKLVKIYDIPEDFIKLPEVEDGDYDEKILENTTF